LELKKTFSTFTLQIEKFEDTVKNERMAVERQSRDITMFYAKLEQIKHSVEKTDANMIKL
jgi:archaellum component FlaC